MSQGNFNKFDELHRLIIKVFSLEELKTLSWSINVEYDVLSGDGLEAKARELIGRLDRRDRLQDLIIACKKVRPDQEWSSFLPVRDKNTTQSNLQLPSNRTSIDFANRKTELNQIRASNNSVIVIDAPPKYGKSYLLETLLSEFRQPKNGEEPWRCIWINFESLTSKRQIADAIIQSLGRQVISASAPSQEVIEDELQVALASQRRLIIFADSVPSNRFLDVEWFAHLVRKMTNSGLTITVRAVFAGRNIRRMAWISHLPISLSPFTQESIREVLDQLYEGDNKGRIAREILALTAGHPAAIERVVIALLNRNWMWFKPYDPGEVYRQHVDSQISELFDGLDIDMQESLITLSVFRNFHTNMIIGMKAKGLTISSVKPSEVISRLTRQDLCGSLPGFGHAIHKHVRQLLVTKIKYTRSEDVFRNLHRIAREIHQDCFMTTVNLIKAMLELPEEHDNNYLEQSFLYFQEMIYHAIMEVSTFQAFSAAVVDVFEKNSERIAILLRHQATWLEQIQNSIRQDQDIQDELSNRDVTLEDFLSTFRLPN